MLKVKSVQRQKRASGSRSCEAENGSWLVVRQESDTQGGESRGLKMGQQYMGHCANSYLILVHVSTSQRPLYFWAEQISSLQSKDLCTPTNSPVGERIINPNFQMMRWRLRGNTTHPKLHSQLVAKSKFLFSFKTCAPSMPFHQIPCECSLLLCDVSVFCSPLLQIFPVVMLPDVSCLSHGIKGLAELRYVNTSVPSVSLHASLANDFCKVLIVWVGKCSNVCSRELKPDLFFF